MLCSFKTQPKVFLTLIELDPFLYLEYNKSQCRINKKKCKNVGIIKIKAVYSESG